MKQTLYCVSLALIMILYGCKKSDKDDDPGDTTNDLQVFNAAECTERSFAGVDIMVDGNISSLMTPGSESYNNYLSCVEACADTNNECIMDCMGNIGIFPSGGAFSVVIYITNTTTTIQTIVIEPGTWFLPGSDEYQPMLCALTLNIEVPANSTVTEVIPVYCLASSKSAPDGESYYTICDQVTSDCLNDIVDILKTKHSDQFDFTQSTQVQANIWNCTVGEPVDWAYLNALP